MTVRVLDILMYHSVSEGAGPTCIAPAVFREQMAALAESGYHAIALADAAAWIRGDRDLEGRPVVLTFDDGFEDFAAVAFPELEARGWTATVFLPADKVGGTDDWEVGSARRLLGWGTVAQLAQQGIDFGAHGVSHADLSMLSPEAARQEVVDSKHQIEDRAGCCVRHFAPPFGRSSAAVQAAVREHYAAAVGTRLARARRRADIYELPRIEMWYFRNPRRWRAYLAGRAEGYLHLRRAFRAVRALAFK